MKIDLLQNGEPVASIESTSQGKLRASGPKKAVVEADAELAAIGLAQTASPENVTADQVLQALLTKAPDRYKESTEGTVA